MMRNTVHSGAYLVSSATARWMVIVRTWIYTGAGEQAACILSTLKVSCNC